MLQSSSPDAVPLFEVTIPGEPVGKGRPRFTRKGHAYTPQKTKDWETSAALVMRAAWIGPPLDQPLRCVVEAVRSPQKKRTWAHTKPDADNYMKAAGDALEKAGVLVNDSRIVDLRCIKRHATEGEEPCVKVCLYAVA